MSLGIGTRLGPYEVTAAIGSGGMGEVYRARDTRLGRDVAVKVLPAAMAGHSDRQARFEREARAVASLNHPHICAVYDVGRQPDDAGRTVEFLVMELLDGETLVARLARGGRRSSPAMPGGTTPHATGSSSPPAAAAGAGAGPIGRFAAGRCRSTRRCGSRRSWPTRSPPRIAPGSCIGISSRRTSCSPSPA